MLFVGREGKTSENDMPYYRMYGSVSREIDVWTNYAGKDNIVITHITSAERATLGAPGEVETYALCDGVEPLAWNPTTSQWENFYTVLGIPISAGPKGDKGDTGDAGADGADARRIDNYSGVTDADGLFTVVYPTAFASAPMVLLESTVAGEAWEKIASDESGFSFRLTNSSGNVIGSNVKAAVL